MRNRRQKLLSAANEKETKRHETRLEGSVLWLKNRMAPETALKILHDIEVNNAYIKIAFDRNLKDEDNKGRYRVDYRMVFRTVRLKSKLDYIIESFSKIRMERIFHGFLIYFVLACIRTCSPIKYRFPPP